MQVGICPRMASQGNKRGCTLKMRASGAEIAGGEPSAFGPRPRRPTCQVALPPVCVGFAGWTVSEGWIRGNADAWGLLSPSSAGPE